GCGGRRFPLTIRAGLPVPVRSLTRDVSIPVGIDVVRPLRDAIHLLHSRVPLHRARCVARFVRGVVVDIVVRWQLRRSRAANTSRATDTSHTPTATDAASTSYSTHPPYTPTP